LFKHGLHRLVTDAQAQYEEQMLAHHFRVAEQKARRHDLARRLRAAVEHDGLTEDVQQQFEAAARYTPPVAKRYLVNDTTVEKPMRVLRWRRRRMSSS
jgi:hypothetical protein